VSEQGQKILVWWALIFATIFGVFAWNGLLVFWSPLSLFGVWIVVMAVLLFRAINAQIADRDRELVVAVQ